MALAETLSLDRSDPSDRSFLSRSSSLSSPFPDREVQAQHPCARLLVAMITVLEMSTFIPTLWLELRLGRAIEQFVLRLSLMLLRLYPIWRVLTMCLYHRGLARCVVMLPFSFQWRCRHWLQRSGSCSKLPEIRWGLAVTLDLWFLLTTHLVEGLGGAMATACVAFLLVNSLLCTFDILTLVMLLLYGKQNVAEIYPEVTFHRSKSIKWGIPEGGTDSTCAICLSEFAVGESVQLLPCGHVFHTDCIAHWLRVSHHCPMRCPEFVFPPQLSRESDAESVTVLRGESSGGPDELMVLPGEVPS